MAVREVTDAGTLTVTSTNNGAVTTIATENPFTFKDVGDLNNSTSVKTAGLFDRTCSSVVVTGLETGMCDGNDGSMRMFSIQSIDVAVGEGDSLDVTWTITTGG